MLSSSVCNGTCNKQIGLSACLLILFITRMITDQIGYTIKNKSHSNNSGNHDNKSGM